MRQGDEALVRRLGKALQVQLENDTHELLPRRWVDLIQYLDEQERRQQQTTVFQARQS